MHPWVRTDSAHAHACVYLTSKQYVVILDSDIFNLKKVNYYVLSCHVPSGWMFSLCVRVQNLDPSRSVRCWFRFLDGRRPKQLAAITEVTKINWRCRLPGSRLGLGATSWSSINLDRLNCWWGWFRSCRKIYSDRVRSPYSRSHRVACCWKIYLLDPSRRNLKAPNSPTWRATVDVWDHDYGICMVWGSLVPGYMRDCGKRDENKDFYTGSGPLFDR